MSSVTHLEEERLNNHAAVPLIQSWSKMSFSFGCRLFWLVFSPQLVWIVKVDVGGRFDLMWLKFIGWERHGHKWLSKWTIRSVETHFDIPFVLISYAYLIGRKCMVRDWIPSTFFKLIKWILLWVWQIQFSHCSSGLLHSKSLHLK